MSVSRRDFIARSAVLSGGALLPAMLDKAAVPIVPAAVPLYIMATNWGFAGSWDAFCQAASKAGYEGVEVWAPPLEEKQDFLSGVQKHKLKFGFLVGSGESDPGKHIVQFEKNLRYAADMKPLYINCHAGKDYYSRENALKIFQLTRSISDATRIPIYHETHRSRLLFAAHVTHQYLKEVPALELTLDISHWCNVHESLLGDQPEAVAAALSRTSHIHARVGHPQGPQVNDPRAPEWNRTLEKHLQWWDTAIAGLVKKQVPFITITTEFGPADYMPTVPYTRREIADQWDINLYMKDLLKSRYK